MTTAITPCKCYRIQSTLELQTKVLSVLNVKTLLGAFNQGKAVIVKTQWKVGTEFEFLSGVKVLVSDVFRLRRLRIIAACCGC